MLAVFFPVILILLILATFSTRNSGLFSQERIGLNGNSFTMFKVRTMREPGKQITTLGVFLRRTKLDELPQLFNIFFGDMSFVGPRPDIKGFADVLEGDDRLILEVKPGLTGPASLKYKYEEELLKQQEDPEQYNREIIWKDKVVINKEYVKNWSFRKDLNYIMKSVIG